MSNQLENKSPLALEPLEGNLEINGNANRLDESCPTADAKASEAALEPQSDEALAFLRWHAPTGPWKLVAIDPAKQRPLTGKTFDASEAEACATWIDTANRASNVYYHVNPARPCGAKAGATHVAELAFLHVDLDPRPAEDLAEEQARALALLTTKLPQNVPAPSAIIFSGGGYQALWRLSDPIALDGTEAAAHAAKRWNIGLEEKFAADNCHNIDRVLRLPGTINWPDARKRNKGRSPAFARTISLNDRVYPLSAFTPPERLIDAAAPNVSRRSQRQTAPRETLALTEAELKALPIDERVQTIIMYGHDPESPKVNDNSRSAWVFDVCCHLVRAGIDDNVAIVILTDPNYGISESIREKRGRARAYAERQIAKAREAVENSALEFAIDEKGKPLKNQKNVKVGLVKLGVALRYDQFSDRILAGTAPVDDAELVRIRLLIDQRFGVLFQKEFFADVVSNIARQNAFHPVCDYLDSLAWDGTPRIDNWLCTYAGAKDSEYVRAVGRLWLIAAVRRVREPGCKFDEMLVLESDQGKDKSTALAVLANNDDWFSDDLPLNRDTKEAIERTKGRWIIEAAELKGMRKGEVETLKAFLSRRVDKARLAYGRVTSEVPRQFILAGTTNNKRYLKDQTGNRRFWPIEVGAFDIPALRRDHNQLWAEAAVYEAQGESIRLASDLWAMAAVEQSERKVEDPWVQVFAALLRDRNGKLRAGDAWEIVGVPVDRRSQEHNERLGEVLRELGFERTKLRFGGPGSEWCYARGSKDERQYRLHIELDDFRRPKGVTLLDDRGRPPPAEEPGQADIPF